MHGVALRPGRQVGLLEPYLLLDGRAAGGRAEYDPPVGVGVRAGHQLALQVLAEDAFDLVESVGLKRRRRWARIQCSRCCRHGSVLILV